MGNLNHDWHDVKTIGMMLPLPSPLWLPVCAGMTKDGWGNHGSKPPCIPPLEKGEGKYDKNEQTKREGETEK